MHIGDPAEACGGVIGSPDNKKFCAVHPSECAFQRTHLGTKFELVTDSLYVICPKKGSLYATLGPTRLPRNYVPKNKALEDLLNDERPVPMWHVYFDECKAAEDPTGDNELGSGPGVSWEDDERPSLEFLEKANDFHTPKKVKVSPLYNEGTEPLNLGYVDPLNTKDPSSSETDQSEVQSTLRDMLEGWKVISSNFLALNSWTNDKEVDTGVVCAQLEKLTDYMNEVGAKTQLLHAKIGGNPRADEEGEPTLWTVLLAELKTVQDYGTCPSEASFFASRSSGDFV